MIGIVWGVRAFPDCCNKKKNLQNFFFIHTMHSLRIARTDLGKKKKGGKNGEMSKLQSSYWNLLLVVRRGGLLFKFRRIIWIDFGHVNDFTRVVPK